MYFCSIGKKSAYELVALLLEFFYKKEMKNRTGTNKTIKFPKMITILDMEISKNKIMLIRDFKLEQNLL